ncbi:MAG: tetratricopeptide repeat protein, partial [Chloroflexi bacterium]|nr:tetratricopeptide repeat protein [Chloroflexota bacterium]
MHLLLRDFSHERLRRNERAYAVSLRMATFYCELAKYYGPRLHGGEGLHEADVLNALQVLEQERTNIFAGQGWARENETREARELTRDYIDGMMHYFNLRANWAEWIEWSEYALAACEQLSDEKAAGAISGNLGIVYRQKGEWDKAIEFYQKDLAISERMGDVHGMAQTYNNLGFVYADKGEWDTAIAFYQQSERTS